MIYKPLFNTVIQSLELTPRFVSTLFLALFLVVPVTHAAPTTYTLLVKTVGDGTGNVMSQPAGISCGDQCTADYESGTTVLLAATPADDSSFLGWEGDCNNGQVVMDDHKSCTAAFTLVPIYTLDVSKNGPGSGTVSSIPAGIDCGSDCKESYKGYTPIIVTLTPTAEVGSSFKGWTGDCSSEGAEQVSMDQNRHCIATFESAGVLQFASETLVVNEEAEATLTVSRVGGTSGGVLIDYTTTDGTANADIDYKVSSGTLTWLDGDSEDKTITVTILPDKLTEEHETFNLTLSNPRGGALLGESHQLELTIVDVPWVSSVQFAMPQYSVNENQHEVSLLVTRAGSDTWPLTVDYETADWTATAAESDYTQVSGTLTWESGDRSPQFISVSVREDSFEEGTEIFYVNLINISSDAQFGANRQATVKIVDTPTASRVEFSSSEYSVNEGSVEITIPIQRFGNSTEAVSVNYATVNSSAKAGEDYTATQGTLSWAAGDVESKYFTVPILSDNQEEGEETLTLMLTNPTGGTSLGTTATAILKILESTGGSTSPGDNDNAYPGILQFTEPSYDAAERDGRMTIAVTRINGSRGAVAVTYATEDDSAIAGQDYQNSQGELRWENGETGEKRFSVGILDDTLREETKHLKIILSTPSGGAALGENAQAVITIQDDDTTILLLSSETYETSTSTTEVTITVTRNGSSLGQVSVNYATSDDTATAGEDYTTTTGKLIWLSGERSDKMVTIPIVFDSTIEGDETLQFSLANASGNAILGTPSEAVVTITESEQNNCEAAQVIDCHLINDDETSPLQDIDITLNGTVTGGKLHGAIQNSGLVQNVTLLPNTQIIGGRVGGHISGDPEQPATAMLRNVNIVEGTTLTDVVIGIGSVIDSSVINDGLGEGVRFEDNSLIPQQVDLGELLGKAATEVLGQKAVKLTDDVLSNSANGGILGAINSLPQLEDSGLVLTQDIEGLGLLTLDIEDMRYAILPMQVKYKVENSLPLGMTVDNDGQLTFVTHTVREVTTHPVVQAPAEFNEALHSLSLNEAEMLDNGNLKIPVDEGTYFIARANLYATQVPTETPLGITVTATGVSLVFEDSDGIRRQQFIYPAAADPEAVHLLSANNPETRLNNDGQVVIPIDDRQYQGQLDYLVTSSEQSTVGVQVQDIADVNGDSCDDYRIDYPNGESQVIFCLLR